MRETNNPILDNCPRFYNYEYRAKVFGSGYKSEYGSHLNGAQTMKGGDAYDLTEQRKARAAFREERSPKENGYPRLSYP